MSCSLKWWVANVVDVQLAAGHQLEQQRRGVAVDQAHGDRDVVNPEVLQLEVDRCSVHPDVGHAPARADDLGAHLERLRDADRFDGDVHAPAVGQRHDLLLPVGVAGVDAVRGAELLRLLDPVGVQVDRDDPGRPVEAGGRDHGESDRTGTDHGDHVPGLHLPVLDADLEARRQDVAEQHALLVGHALGHLVHGGLGVRAPARTRPGCHRSDGRRPSRSPTRPRRRGSARRCPAGRSCSDRTT